MGALSGIYPERVFSFFEDICAIPHGSGNTAALRDYLMAFAASRGLPYRCDAAGNVVVTKIASAGKENSGAVILQGHYDMVCEKEPGCLLDMAVSGVTPYSDGGFVRARGTTLGADDGIAVAYMLSVLDADDIAHPRIEAVFTNDEETGLFGASALDMSGLSGTRLINLDSEAEGIFIAGCAGGVRLKCAIPVKRETAAGTVCTVTVGGCAGGHSGMMIARGGANPIKLLGKFLAGLSGGRIISLSGGGKDNAIPRMATVSLLTRSPEKLVRLAEEFGRALKTEFSETDPDIYVSSAPGRQWTADALDPESAERLMAFLENVPNGVQRMSADIEGLVETSLNLGVLSSDEACVSAVFALRSSVGGERDALKALVTRHCEAAGGSTSSAGEYPAWEYNKNSSLREKMATVYRGLYGGEPVTEIIHAGLECGIFAGKRPDIDCVSIGPDNFGAHTPEEHLDIASAGRVWDFLVRVLGEL